MTAIPVPVPPDAARPLLAWPALHSSARALALATAARADRRLWVVLVEDERRLDQLRRELAFFAGADLPVLQLPDWEVLPYDRFSPLPDLVSERIATLARLPQMASGLLLVGAGTLLQRLPPLPYIAGRAFDLAVGGTFAMAAVSEQLARAGYSHVAQVGVPNPEVQFPAPTVPPFANQPHPFNNPHPSLPNAGLGHAGNYGQVIGQIWVPPTPGIMPRPVSGKLKLASVAATHWSQSIAISKPPPATAPCTPAMIGWVSLVRVPQTSRCQRMRRAAVGDGALPNSRRSPPLQNARPLPNRTTARTSGSSRTAVSAVKRPSRMPVS